MNNTNACAVRTLSEHTVGTIQPLVYIALLATVTHTLFWIQLMAYPAVRQWSMQWLYAYLTTDLLLLVRFFFFYIYQRWSLCVPHLLRMIICYSEAIFDNYLNLLQSYILLALNICRYLQIAYHHNVYSSNRRIIIIAHFFIYILPLCGHLVAILLGWTVLVNPLDDACDLLPISLIVRILFLLLSYFVPVTLTLVFLSLCLNCIRNTDGIHAQEIVHARHKYHRQLVIQSTVFYSIWILLWSPHILLFPFFYKNSAIGTIAQLLNYTSITLDPIVIATLDVRFFRAWTLTCDYLKKCTRRHRTSMVSKTSSSEHEEATIRFDELRCNY